MTHTNGQPNSVEKAVNSLFKFLDYANNGSNQAPLRLIIVNEHIDSEEITDILGSDEIPYLWAQPLKVK